MTDALRKILTPKQIEVIEFDEIHKPRHIILEGAIRSAKTIANIHLFLAHVHGFKNRNKKFIITGTSIASIKRNVLDEIMRLFEIPTNLNQKSEFKLFGNTVICFGADKADSFTAMKGFTAYGWLANEVTEHHINTIDQAFKRCSGFGSRIFWDTNPAEPTHPVKEKFIDRSGCLLENGQINIKSFHFILDDNIFLPKEYIQSIKETTPSGIWYDRDILGLWVANSNEQIGAFLSVPAWDCQYSVAFIDPSFSDRQDTDSTAVAIAGVSKNLIIFTGRLWQKSIANPEVRKEMLDFLNVYKPIESVLESQLQPSSNVFSLDALKTDELKYGYDIKNLWTIKHQTRNKHERIMSIITANKERMRILEGTQQYFSLELSRYYKHAEHDDAPDSLAGAIEALGTSEIVAEYAKAIYMLNQRK